MVKVLAADCAPSVCPAALALLLVDMGNGVVRVEGAQAFPRPPPVSDLLALGFSSVVFPLSARIEDAVCCALASLEVYEPHAFQEGALRFVRETITEFRFW